MYRMYCMLVAVAAVQLAYGEIFTALVELERVLHAENTLAGDLRSYIRKEELRLEQLRKIADDYELHSKNILNSDQGPESYLSNPVNAFLLVKRFTSDWEKVETLIRNNTSDVFLNDISHTLSYFPDGEDLTGAATALLRLQDTYSLQTDKLARGEIDGAQRSQELSAQDCYELGRIAYNGGDYYHTILWMTQALDLMKNTPSEHDPGMSVTLDYLAYATYVQGNIRAALNLTIEWLRIDPNHVRAMNNKKYYEEMLAEQEGSKRKGDDGEEPEPIKNQRQLDEYRSSHEFQTYEALCRGENVVPNPKAHKLTCRYSRHHPYWLLRPLKEETMYHDPWIRVYHDLLTNEEVAKVKELASPRLEPALVNDPVTGAHRSSKHRTAKSAWLKDEEHELISHISYKVTACSGLSLETAEELQVVNYGIGGHYEPHYDFARPREVSTFDDWRGNRIATAIYYGNDTKFNPEYLKTNGNRIASYILYKDEKTSFRENVGNRIATLIYYMSDVEAGGATVFPQIGIQLYPRKGSMAFWYNLKRSGEGDYRTRHAACPVLAGSKWVCNKWIHERGQEFLYKCDKNPEI